MSAIHHYDTYKGVPIYFFSTGLFLIYHRTKRIVHSTLNDMYQEIDTLVQEG